MLSSTLFKNHNKNISPFIIMGIGISLVFIGFLIARLLFWWVRADYFTSSSSEMVVLAFIHGLRFDLSAIAILNTPLLLVLLVSIWFKSLSRISVQLVIWYVLIVNLTALVINIVDIAYFPYTGRRSGPEVFSMGRDLSSQFPEIMFIYWQYIVISLLFILAFTFSFLKLIKKTSPVYLNQWLLIGFAFVLLFVFVLAGRGGVQSKPIRALSAYSYPSSELGALVLNTPFSLLKENAGTLKKVMYFDDNIAIERALDRGAPLEANDIRKKNVVIIILESFGLEYFGKPYGMKSYAPFLESLAKKSRFFPNGIANGRRSIEAVPSILAGIPSLMSEAFVRSPYQSNTLYGVGQLVKQYDYSTAFFHGAKNGSMYFDDTVYRLGFDHYYGRNEYPDQSQFDGQWGIFDEPFLQFSVNKIDQMSKPFMAGIFTISSHPPYTLPKQYQNEFTEANIPMHRVIQYSDMALRKFFESASTKSWYKDTLFVISADHTSDNYDPRFASSLARHQIPIILYQPAGELEVDVKTQIAQQIDIPATIVDYLNLPDWDKVLPFGQSLLKDDQNADAIIKEDGAYWLLSQAGYVQLTEGMDFDVKYDQLPDTFLKSGIDGEVDIDRLKNRLKAYIQIYKNGLIDNTLYQFSKTGLGE